ncbi:transglutaminase family protein [Maricaulis parjimensis]|uniref:transglutaminase family protein n=1 Tax=Maricaulis parjimensis TaxID=144023 RepID=UPI001939B7D9|nr:transglutaminase family protein [Maricaulis parjimensis]
MQLTIAHQTRYTFETPIPYGLQQVRLRPVCSGTQSVSDWEVSIEGGSLQARFPDEHGNAVDLVRVDQGSRELIISCRGTVDTKDTSGMSGPHEGPAPLWYYTRQTDRTRPGPAMRKLAKSVEGESGNALARMHDLSRLITEKIRYDIGATHVATSGEEAAAAGHGVCQDHAHILIGIARQMGLPARYVSGYLMIDGLIDQEASHAWAEVHVESLGWVGFDPSNGISPDERYVRVATGLDYAEAAPISGVTYGGGEETLLVTLQVQQ